MNEFAIGFTSNKLSIIVTGNEFAICFTGNEFVISNESAIDLRIMISY